MAVGGLLIGLKMDGSSKTIFWNIKNNKSIYFPQTSPNRSVYATGLKALGVPFA
jgi:hypothetical protein